MVLEVAGILIDTKMGRCLFVLKRTTDRTGYFVLKIPVFYCCDFNRIVYFTS